MPVFHHGTPGDATVVASGNIQLDVSPNAQGGDLLIAEIAYAGNAAFTLPGGWTLLTQQNSGNTSDVEGTSIRSLLIAYRLTVGPEPAAYTFTRVGGGVAVGWTRRFRGHKQSDPILGSVGATMGANGLSVATAAGLTTLAADTAMVMTLSGWVSAVSAANFTAEGAATDPVSPWNELGFWVSTAAGENVGLETAAKTKPSAGATGVFSATQAANTRSAIIAYGINAALSDTVAPSPATAKGSTIAPTVKTGPIVAEPNAAVAKGAVVNPSVVGSSSSVTPAAAIASGLVVAPLVVFQSQTVAPVNANAKSAVVAPTVRAELVVQPDPVSARADVALPSLLVAQGPLFFPQGAFEAAWTQEAPLQ